MKRLRELVKKYRVLLREVISFGIVGLAVNILIYVFYLLLTGFGIGPKVAATFCHISAIFFNFPAQKSITFRNDAPYKKQLVHFAVVSLSAYAVNMAGLYILVDILQYPHQIVQAALAVLFAGISFIVQKLWIFRKA